MARNFPHYIELPDRTRVGYALTRRNGVYRVRFVNPAGKRAELTTGFAAKADAVLAAERIVRAACSPSAPDPTRVTWELAISELAVACGDLRPRSVKDYQLSVRVLVDTFDRDAALTRKPAGPLDITPELAARFKRLYLAHPYRRGKASDAKQYRRSPATLAAHLRKLSALWNEHFRELGYVTDNPWRHVSKPETERRRKPVPTEDQIAHFVAWVDARYAGWVLLRRFLEVKLLSGCRTMDLCQLRSAQLTDGRVVWEPHQTKHKQGRAVLLPPALYESLRSLAGPVYLWERFTDDARQYRPARRPPAAFTPHTLAHSVANIFREYNAAHPDRPRLSPHALRRRAITLTAQATGSVDLTAQAIGIDPQTARTYYLDARRAFDTDAVFRQVAGTLLPPPAADPDPPG